MFKKAKTDFNGDVRIMELFLQNVHGNCDNSLQGDSGMKTFESKYFPSLRKLKK